MRATYADCRLLDPLRSARHHGVLVLAFAGTAAAGPPELIVAAVWAGQDGTIALGLDSELYAITADQPATPLLLRLQPAQPGARIKVRQRSVTYLNLSEDGPHIAVPGTEGRSAWTTLTAASADYRHDRRWAQHAVHRAGGISERLPGRVKAAAQAGVGHSCASFIASFFGFGRTQGPPLSRRITRFG